MVVWNGACPKELVMVMVGNVRISFCFLAPERLQGPQCLSASSDTELKATSDATQTSQVMLVRGEKTNSI